ncbi:MAG: hypothetical protein V1660_03830 [archaeon]
MESKNRQFICLIIISLILIPNVTALDISLSKKEYFPSETFQANITGQFFKPLEVNNIYFMDSEGKEAGLAFYMLKVSETNYWVYVDLPSKVGAYHFKIKNALYREDGVLKGTEKEEIFEIKNSISSFYKDIESELSSKISTLSTKDLSLVLLSLSYSPSISYAVKQEINSRKSSSNSCWNPSPPSSLPCTIKETALTIWALKKNSAEVGTSWIIDSQNNLEIGLWDVVLDSPSEGQCEIYVNSEKKIVNISANQNTINIDLKSKPSFVQIIANCTPNNAKILHTYLGKISEFPMQAGGSYFSIMLNNEKCFGKYFRSECDIDSTIYAAIALENLELDNDGAISWIKKNAATIKEKSVALYFGDSSTKDFLLNNQHQQGYFTKNSLIQTPSPDLDATLFASLALQKAKENNAALKAEKWLQESIYGNLSMELESAVFVFPNAKIESISSIIPSAVKVKTANNFTITFKNRGVTDSSFSINFSPFGIKREFSLKQNEEKKEIFEIPSKIGKNPISGNITAYLEVTASKFISSSYSIPVFILSEVINGTITIIEVPKEHFRFVESEINLTILAKEDSLVAVTIKNSGQTVLKDISLSYSRDLNSVINLSSMRIKEIDAGSQIQVPIIFKSQKEGNYIGFIMASNDEVSAILPINITFTKNESQITKNTTSIVSQQNKTCKDYNGTVCKKEQICNGGSILINGERCCIAKCEKKKDTRLLGIAMIVLAILIIFFAVLTKLKKPKKEMKDVVAEIEKKYDKFPQTKSQVV